MKLKLIKVIFNKQDSNDTKSDLNDNLNVIYRNNNNDINNMKSSTYTRGKKRTRTEQNLFYSPNIVNTNNHTRLIELIIIMII